MSELLTAAEVAQRLRISARKVYALAASGELASHRFGGAVRFDPADIESYKSTCRSPAITRAAGSTNLTASLADGEHALTDYFRKAGRAPKRKPSTSEKAHGSTKLQLVGSGPNR